MTAETMRLFAARTCSMRSRCALRRRSGDAFGDSPFVRIANISDATASLLRELGCKLRTPRVGAHQREDDLAVGVGRGPGARDRSEGGANRRAGQKASAVQVWHRESQLGGGNKTVSFFWIASENEGQEGTDLDGQPASEIRADELVVVQFGIRLVDAVDFGALAG